MSLNSNLLPNFFNIHSTIGRCHHEPKNLMELCPPDKLKKYLEFRINFLQEELDETQRAAFIYEDPEEIVDGLIDLCVVAIGTLDAFGVDANAAWDEVLKANMAKEVGVKPERPNPLGLPDLMKPEGWQPPSHEGNTGKF